MSTLSSLITPSIHTYASYLFFFLILTSVEMSLVRERQPLKCRAHGIMIWLAYIPASIVIYHALYSVWAYLGIRPVISFSVIKALGWAGPGAVAGAAIIGAFAADFINYWYHRAQHRFLWRFHAVHHSIRELNAVNSYHHASEALFSGFLVALPTTLVVVDYGPTIPLLLGLTSLQAIYLHSPSKINAGRLRALFGDNVWHRVHHSIDEKHFDKNFGVLTTFWDRIFGTAYFPRSDEWPDVGIADMPQPTDLLDWFILPARCGKGVV